MYAKTLLTEGYYKPPKKQTKAVSSKATSKKKKPKIKK
tara:strand:+ start:704 stop:817 length:114 start_codon:yes stop_codon:yes gene_type:complete